MRHTIPDGDVAEIVSRALTLLVNHLEKTRGFGGGSPARWRTGGCDSSLMTVSRRRPGSGALRRRSRSH